MEHTVNDGSMVENAPLSIVDLSCVVFFRLQLEDLDAAVVSYLLMGCCSDLERRQK